MELAFISKVDTRRHRGVFAGVMVSLGIILSVLPSAWGHKVNLFTYVEGENVIVDGYFSGKSKAVGCLVEVLDPEGNKILEGKTDANGIYSFRIADVTTVKGQLTIVLHAGMGHKAFSTLGTEDLPASSAGTSFAHPQSEKGDTKQDSPDQAQPPIQIQDVTLLKKIVEETLDAKLQPLVSMVSNQQKLLMEQRDKGPTIIEVVGGIGWIFGVVGVGAYFMNRSRIQKR